LIAYLGLGSNINPEDNITKAKRALLDIFDKVRFSRTFESQAVGFDGDNFFNLVAEIEVNDRLEYLIAQLKKIEDVLGRVRGGEKFSSRHIDIDILLFGNMTCQKPIVLPREEILLNAYVLWPLAELAPDLIEPVVKKTYRQLWQDFDKSSQQLQPV